MSPGYAPPHLSTTVLQTPDMQSAGMLQKIAVRARPHVEAMKCPEAQSESS